MSLTRVYELLRVAEATGPEQPQQPGQREQPDEREGSRADGGGQCDAVMTGEQARAARTWLGLSPRALAEVLAVPEAELRGWEGAGGVHGAGEPGGVPAVAAARLRRLRQEAAAVMSAAELRVAREDLGLSPEGFANVFGVDLRSLRRWEQDVLRVPVGVAEEVAGAQLRAAADVASLVAGAQEAMPQGAAGEAGAPPTLVTYASDEDCHRAEPGVGGWPASAHRRLVARALVSLPGARVLYAGTGAQQT